MFFLCFDAEPMDIVTNTSYSYVQPYMTQRYQEVSACKEMWEKKGVYGYLQEQLCSDNLIVEVLGVDKSEPKNFSTILNTPFGQVTVSFRYCPVQKRYNRFICGAGKYTDLMKKLDNEYESEEERKSIYGEILAYLKSKPVNKGSNPLMAPRVCSKYQNKQLAYFCAILAVSDPCYGIGADGGKQVRSALISDECKNGCLFKNFLDVSFYPMCQKRAYILARGISQGKRMRISPKTLEGILKRLEDYSPLKITIEQQCARRTEDPQRAIEGNSLKQKRAGGNNVVTTPMKSRDSRRTVDTQRAIEGNSLKRKRDGIDNVATTPLKHRCLGELIN